VGDVAFVLSKPVGHPISPHLGSAHMLASRASEKKLRDTLETTSRLIGLAYEVPLRDILSNFSVLV